MDLQMQKVWMPKYNYNQIGIKTTLSFGGDYYK